MRKFLLFYALFSAHVTGGCTIKPDVTVKSVIIEADVPPFCGDGGVLEPALCKDIEPEPPPLEDDSDDSGTER